MDYNFDAMDAEDLWAFWQKIETIRPIRFARTLFPDRPKGYVTATIALGCYASNKATAMQCRLRGEIQTAINYEGICERIYNRLPEYARW